MEEAINKKKIALIGATGAVGREIVRQATNPNNDG